MYDFLVKFFEYENWPEKYFSFFNFWQEINKKNFPTHNVFWECWITETNLKIFSFKKDNLLLSTFFVMYLGNTICCATHYCMCLKWFKVEKTAVHLSKNRKPNRADSTISSTKNEHNDQMWLKFWSVLVVVWQSWVPKSSKHATKIEKQPIETLAHKSSLMELFRLLPHERSSEDPRFCVHGNFRYARIFGANLWKCFPKFVGHIYVSLMRPLDRIGG